MLKMLKIQRGYLQKKCLKLLKMLKMLKVFWVLAPPLPPIFFGGGGQDPENF